MEIQGIKQPLSIETVLKYYSLQANRNHMLKCPFHEETEPSLKIYANTNTFNCFGCKANGDTIDFIQLKEKCSKHAAILKAKEILAVPTDSVGEALKKATELINPCTSRFATVMGK